MHKCEATPCPKSVPDNRAMCYRHWKMVPVDIQRRVWAYYRPAQTALTASVEYKRALNDAVNYVRRIEGRRPVPFSDGLQANG